MKKEIRVLGIDDAPFSKGDAEVLREQSSPAPQKPSVSEVLVVGAFFRGGEWMDGVMSNKVEVDGEDATVKLIEMVNKSKFKEQLQAVLLDGIALGGFNVVNIESLFRETGVPVIVVVRRMPDFLKLEKTLRKLGMEKKYKLMEKAGKPVEVKLKQGKVFMQFVGLEPGEAEEIIRVCCTRSYLPEAIRAAHLIGAGIVSGESKGKV